MNVERRGAAAILRMDKARGNSIDASLVRDLSAAAREMGQDDSVRGVLLSSAHPKLFSPGLDLVTLIEMDRPALQAFMGEFAEMVWALFGLTKPMVAGVNGHAVAGGCILALTADHRVLRRGGAQIGLNEVRVGVPLPWSVTLLLQASVPPHTVARVALLGRNFADDDALAVGLAHELADAGGFEDHCLARLEEFLEKDAYALATTKRYLRAGVLDSMRQGEGSHMDEWLTGWFAPSTQQRIRETVAALSRGK